MLDLEEPIPWEILMVGIQSDICEDVMLDQQGIFPRIKLVVAGQGSTTLFNFPLMYIKGIPSITFASLTTVVASGKIPTPGDR
jgi:hypothetical protein